MNYLADILIYKNVKIFMIFHKFFSSKVSFRMSKGEIYLVSADTSGVKLITSKSIPADMSG